MTCLNSPAWYRAGELSVEVEDKWWKVQADVCLPFSPISLCQCLLSLILAFGPSLFFLPLYLLSIMPMSWFTSACPSFFLSGFHYSFLPSPSLFSHSSYWRLLFFLLPSLSLPGLNHRTWWPWEWPSLGPQEQDLLQIRSPEEGGQRPPAPWRGQLPGGLEERCGLGCQGLREGALPQRSLHRTSSLTLIVSTKN